MGPDSWQYEPAEDLDLSLVERLRHFPRRPDISVYGLRSLAALAVRGWMRTYHRLKVVGAQNLPKVGSYILVANHTSHLDTLSILSALPLRTIHRVFPAAAKDFFFVSMHRTVAAAIIVNALPFDRESNIRQSLSLCGALLANPGNVLLLFPEGTRSTTGELAEFKPGIGMLLAGNEYPVIPCYVDGAYRALPKGSHIPRPYAIELRIGVPRRYDHLKRGKQAAIEICQDLRDAIVELSGQHQPNTTTTRDTES